METKEPAIIHIEKTHKKDYESLLRDPGSPFRGRENKNVFIMAMVVGFKEGSRIKLNKRDPGGFFRTEYLNDREKTIIKAIAVEEEGNLAVLNDKRRVYSIAEEYATGGLKILLNKVFSGTGSYTKRLESELLDEFQRFKKDVTHD